MRVFLSFIFAATFVLGLKAISKRMFIYLLFNILTLALSLIPLVVNQSQDTALFKTLLGTFLCSTSMYLIIVYKNIDKTNSIHIVLWGALIHIVLGVLSFIYIDLRSIIRNIDLVGMDWERLEATMRLIGLGGVKYFGAGIYFGVVALIAMGFFMAKRRPLLAWVASLFFVLTGSLFARTTLVSLPLLFVVFILSSKSKTMAIMRISGILITVALLILALHNIYKEEPLYRWGLEPIYNLLEHGELKSASTNKLKTMYKFPDRAHTYLFGDGKYVNRDVMGRESGYYMHTDVGYLRLLYYGGVPMVIAYFIPYMVATVLYLKSRPQKTEKYVFLSLIAFLLILNLKGLASVNFATDIFLFSSFKRGNF